MTEPSPYREFAAGDDAGRRKWVSTGREVAKAHLLQRRTDHGSAPWDQLITAADRDLHDGVDRDVSIGLLRERSARRADLLAETAGHYLRLFLSRGPAPDAPEHVSRLIAAGAD